MAARSGGSGDFHGSLEVSAGTSILWLPDLTLKWTKRIPDKHRETGGKRNKLSFILDIVTSVIFLPIWLGLGISLGILLGVQLSRPKKNLVWKINPNEARGWDLPIEEETAYTVYCKGIARLPEQRFVKLFPGVVTQTAFMGTNRTRNITRYIGLEGSMFSRLPNTSATDKPLPLHTVLRTLWGDSVYDQMPLDLKAKLEENVIQVTVDLDKSLPQKFQALDMGEDQIFREDDKEASHTFWKGKKIVEKGALLQSIAWIGVGAAIALVAGLMMGWIQLRPPYVAPSATA